MKKNTMRSLYVMSIIEMILWVAIAVLSRISNMPASITLLAILWTIYPIQDVIEYNYELRSGVAKSEKLDEDSKK